MTKGVHAAVDGVQPADAYAILDLPRCEADRSQLPELDDVVLDRRQVRDPLVGVTRGALSVHIDGKAPRVLISPPRA